MRSSRFAVIDTSQWPLKAAKWPAVSERLQGLRVVGARRLSVPDELQGSHDESFVADFLSGSLSERAMRRIGIPFSEALVERVLRVTGATVQAAEMVAAGSAEDVAVVGGGAHHAHFDFGAGFCTCVLEIELSRRTNPVVSFPRHLQRFDGCGDAIGKECVVDNCLT